MVVVRIDKSVAISSWKCFVDVSRCLAIIGSLLFLLWMLAVIAVCVFHVLGISDKGNMADWANAIFTLLAFVAAAIAAKFTYNANKIRLQAVSNSLRGAKRQRELELLIEVMAPLLSQAGEKYKECVSSLSGDDRIRHYRAYAYILRSASELDVAFSEVDKSLVHAVGAALAHDFKWELTHLGYLQVVSINEASAIRKMLRENGVVPDSKDFTVVQENTRKFGDDLRKFSSIYLRDFDDDKFSRNLDKIVESVVLASRQNP